MKILIATKNKDKFRTISNMINDVIDEKIEFTCLDDYPYIKENDEIGDNLERAKGKAINVNKQITDDYNFIVGIDDGIMINDIEYVTVKDHLKDIIVNDTIKIGELIYITRAYYIISKTGKVASVYNKIPYIVRRKMKTIEKTGYQLNSVLSMIDNDRVLTDMTDEELNEYYLTYSKEDLEKIINEVK